MMMQGQRIVDPPTGGGKETWSRDIRIALRSQATIGWHP